MQTLNETASSSRHDKLIHQLFEEQAARTPEATAVVCEKRSLTYAKLNAKANRLAHFLRDQGVTPDSLVAICVESSLEMIIGVLAVLKAGGGYLPLDPSYRREQIKFQLQDCAASMLLTDAWGRKTLAGSALQAAGLKVIDLERRAALWEQHSPKNLSATAVGLRPSHLAYVIYTSGSTQKPNGVMVEHRSLQFSTTARLQAYGCYERLLLVFPLSFDSSIAGILGTLASGGTLFVPSADADPWLLGRQLADCKITSIFGVPLLLHALVEICPPEFGCSLKQIINVGEPCNSGLVARIASWAPQAALVNEYGPTETTVWATMHGCTPDPWPVPIGRRIANARIYILDKSLQPVSVGVAGEIYIGGPGVARGYLNRAELTAARFIPDPFCSDPDARMYKSADRGRWRTDGQIELLEFGARNIENIYPLAPPDLKLLFPHLTTRKGSDK